jgi:hypothetical protein
VPLQQYITSHVPHIIITTLALFPAYKIGRFLLDKLGNWAWDSTLGAIQEDRKRLANCDANLSLMMVNHLPHLQAGIDKLVEEQQQTNIILAEQSGYLKGILDKK